MPYATGKRGNVKAELAAKPDYYLLCRDQLHRWTDLDVIEERRKGFLRVVQKCEVCTAERTQLLSMKRNDYGEITKSWISHYPEGYLMPKGFGRLGRRDRGEIRMHRRGY